jgi:hypothetical protein
MQGTEYIRISFPTGSFSRNSLACVNGLTSFAQKKSAHAKAGLTLSLLTQRLGVFHIFFPKIKGRFDVFSGSSCRELQALQDRHGFY